MSSSSSVLEANRLQSPTKSFLDNEKIHSMQASIKKQSRDDYLNALSNWVNDWNLDRPIEQIVQLSWENLNPDDLLHLAEELDSEERISSLREELLEQSRMIQSWIAIAAKGTQNDAIKLTMYLTGIYVPVMISFGRQRDLIEIVDRFVVQSHNGFQKIFGMKHDGMSESDFMTFSVTRLDSKRYRFLMLAPLFMSIAAHYDPRQPGAEDVERMLDSFTGEFVSPCTLLRIGLLAMMIGSKNRALLQRCVSGAKRVGAEDFAQFMIAYATELA